MIKKGILDEISKVKEHLANLEERLKQCNYERWKPELNQKYWYVDSYSNVNYTLFMTGIEVDALRFKNYNCFKSKQEAEQEAEKVLVRRQLEDIARRLNDGKKPDWIKCYQKKYYLGYDQVNSKITLECKTTIITQGVVYCLDANFLDVVLKEIGEERLKKYLRGE